MPQPLEQRLASELSIRPQQVQATIALLDEGATVPFIARYRKEVTGNLDDTQLRHLSERLIYLRELDARRQAILDSITEQGKLTPELAARIDEADSKQRLTQARQHLIKAFAPLLSTQQTGKKRWIGTKTDLLEMVHLAYTFSYVRDDQGRPATFLWMVQRACDNFLLSMPRNPSAFVGKAMQRKNTKQAPLLERYCHLLYERGITEPLHTWMAV